MNHDHFEALLLLGVQLLTAGDLFDQLLHDDTVVKLGLAWGHLDVVHGAEDDSLTGSRRGRVYFEFLALALYFVHCLCAVEGLEHSFCQGALATAGGAVQEHVGEVVRFGELLEDGDLLLVDRSSVCQVEWAVLLDPELLVLLHWLVLAVKLKVLIII